MVSSRTCRWSIARLFIAVVALALMGSAQALAGPADDLAAAHRHVGTAHRSISAGKEVSARANMERAQTRIRRSGRRVLSSRIALRFIVRADAQVDARPRGAKRALRESAKRIRRAIREERRRGASGSTPRPGRAPADGSTQPAPVGATPTPSSIPTLGAEGSGGLVPPTSSPPPGQGEPTLQDPFSDDSVWNTPIPNNPTLAGNQAESSTKLSSYQGNTPVTTGSYGVKVYQADENTPRVDVVKANTWFGYRTVHNFPIEPSWTAAKGSDAHMVVVDQNRCVHEAWGYGKSYQQASILADRLDGSGIFPGGNSMNAAGSSMLGGLIWPSEIAAGEITHALAYSLKMADQLSGGVAAPFTHEAGGRNVAGNIPLGARIQLDPDFDVSTLRDEPSRIIARALQVYGAYNRDNGGTFGIYAVENPEDTPGEPSWADVRMPGTYWYPDLPMDKLRVIAYDLVPGKGYAADDDLGACGSYS